MALVGILEWLSVVPIWTTTVLFYFLLAGIPWILRDRYERFYYNTAVSSQLADGLLFGVVLIGATLLQEGKEPPVLLNTWWLQALGGVAAIAMGVIWRLMDHTGPKPADVYHHLVIAPVFFYLLAIAIVMIVSAGTLAQRWFLALSLMVWVASAMYDVRTGRHQPRRWLPSRGVNIPR